MKANISFDKEVLTAAFKLHYNTKHPIRSRLMLLAGVVLIATGFVLVYFNFPQKPALLKHLITLIGLAYVALYFYRRKKLFERASKQNTFKGEFTFEINKTGIAFGKSGAVSRCTWQNILEIVQDEHNILFYFGKDKFYILPIVHLSDSQKKDTANSIKEYHGK